MARPTRDSRPKRGETIGVRLRALRLAREAREGRKITQAEVAEATGLDVYRVNAYECDRKEPTPPVLVKLADYYGVTLDYLFRGGDLARARLVPMIDDELVRLLDVLVSLPPKQREVVRTVIEALPREAKSTRVPTGTP